VPETGGDIVTLQRRQFLKFAAASLATPAISSIARAQAWPARPLRLVIPFTAGGTTDLLGRVMAQWLSDRLGQTVVVENKPGGGTNIAVQAVVNAPPDGYTMLFIVSTNAINPSLYKSLPFDFQRDIIPVGGLAELPLVLEVNPTVPAKTVAEFIAYCKANPGKVSFASFGARTISHLAIELLKTSAGIDVVHVPYRGGPPLITDKISNRVQAGIDALPNSLPHIRRGAVRALAVLPKDRTPTLPDVPTMSETIPGFVVSTWSGIGVPKGTPNAIVERLNKEINAGLATAEMKKRFADVGASPLFFAPDEMRTMIASDVKKWAKVVKDAGIKPD
jgi:tripartite-type tricarboxylate transporter receptor subunit TctC